MTKKCQLVKHDKQKQKCQTVAEQSGKRAKLEKTYVARQTGKRAKQDKKRFKL